MTDAPLWTPDALQAATGGRLLGEAASVTGASIDTRTLQPGDLFVALKGDARDGHGFVPDALARGAALALVSLSLVGRVDRTGGGRRRVVPALVHASLWSPPAHGTDGKPLALIERQQA